MVVVVVVVVVSPGSVLLVEVVVVVVVVVVVDVDVSPGNVLVVVVATDGHDADATRGLFIIALPLLPIVVLVGDLAATVVVTPSTFGVVSIGATGNVSMGVVSSGSITNARVSAGAAAGGSL